MVIHVQPLNLFLSNYGDQTEIFTLDSLYGTLYFDELRDFRSKGVKLPGLLKVYQRCLC